MRPKTLTTPNRGFSLVSALFLLVVLSALGAYMVSLSATQHHTTMLGLQGAKAYHAARSGAEWAAYRATNGADCDGTFSFTGGALDGFTVVVQCITTNHAEQGASINAHIITSRATNGVPGAVDFAQRTVQAKVAAQ